jgi:hypothetical protein
LSYEGKYIDTICAVKADIFVQDVPCIEIYNALAHDGTPITEGWLTEQFGEGPEVTRDNIMTGNNHTFILTNDRLGIIGKKRKLIRNLDLKKLLPDTAEENYGSAAKLLASNDATVIFAYNDYLFVYDHQKKKLVKLIELTPWQPGRLLINQDQLWIISRRDGLLYGLSF